MTAVRAEKHGRIEWIQGSLALVSSCHTAAAAGVLGLGGQRRSIKGATTG